MDLLVERALTAVLGGQFIEHRLREADQNRRPKGAPDLNGDGRGDGGQFAPGWRNVLDFMVASGLDAYTVGGAIRDELFGREPKDLDFLVAGVSGEQLKKAMQQGASVADLVVGGRLVGVRARIPGGPSEGFEVVPPRKEISTGPGHKDFDIVSDPSTTVEEDLARRDFTVNAIARNIRTGEVVDPFGGVKDIENRVLRTVSPTSFRDDPLRILRGLVRISKDDLTPAAETLEQMRRHASGIRDLSGERIQAELDKLLMGANPAKALRIARDTGVLGEMLPEFKPAIGFDQRSKYHDLTVDEHIFAVVQSAVDANAPIAVRLAALFHDIGKPGSARPNKHGGLSFYGNPEAGVPSHQDLGADLTRKAMNRLRYPQATTNRVVQLVAEHMFRDADKPKAVKARKFRARVGDDLVDDLLALRRADWGGKGHGIPPEDVQRLDEFERLLRQEANAPVRVKDLAISGGDLIGLGYKSGPHIGKALHELVSLVIGAPELNNREWLMRQAIRLLRGAPMREANPYHLPRGAPDRNRDGRGDGGQFTSKPGTDKTRLVIRSLAAAVRSGVPGGRSTTVKETDRLAGFTLQDFKAALDGFTHNGLKVRIKSADPWDWPQDTYDPARSGFRIVAEVVDENGKVASKKLVRSLMRLPDGKVILMNDGLELLPDYRGRRFATEFNKTLFATAKTNGIREVWVNAGLSWGGLAWAKQFMPRGRVGDKRTDAQIGAERIAMIADKQKLDDLVAHYPEYRRAAAALQKRIATPYQIKNNQLEGKITTMAELLKFMPDVTHHYDYPFREDDGEGDPIGPVEGKEWEKMIADYEALKKKPYELVRDKETKQPYKRYHAPIGEYLLKFAHGEDASAKWPGKLYL